MDVFELTAKLTLDTSEYDKALAGAGKSISSVGHAATGASKQVGVFGDVLKANLVSNAITAGVKGVVNTVSAIGGAVLDVGKNVASLAIGGGMDRALNTEQATFKLKGLHMEADQVTEVMKNAKDAATDTAYGLDEMATVAASAVAAGVKPGADLTRTLSLVGDAAAIAGRDIGSMGAIFNKIAASGKIQGDELNQLTDAGIPILQLLGDVLDTDAEGVRKLAKEGKIGFEDFQLAIEKGMGGAALEMGNTFSGGLANLQASIKRIGENIMTPFLNEMTPAMTNLKKIFNAMNGDMSVDVQKNIEELKQHVTTGVSGLITNVGNLLKTMIPVFTEVFAGLTPLISDSIAQIVPLIMELLPTLIESGAQILGAIGQGLMDSAPVIFDALSQLMDSALSNLSQFDWTGAASNIATGLSNAISGGGAAHFIETAVGILSGLVSGIGQSLPILIPAAMDIVSQLANSFSEQIPILFEAAGTLITGLVEGLYNADVISNLLDAGINLCWELGEAVGAQAPKIIAALVKGLISAAPQVVLAGPTLIVALVGGLLSGLAPLLDAGVQMITQLVSTIQAQFGKIMTAGQQLLMKFIEGIKAKFGELANTARNIIETVKKAITEKIAEAKKWGADLMTNFIGGITEKLKDLKNAVAGIGTTISSQLHFSEPDEGVLKDFHTWAPDMMELFAQGIRDNTHLITDQLNKSFDFRDIMEAPFKEADASSNGANLSEVVNLLTQIRDKGNVVILEGDASRMFRVMQSESRKYYQTTGKEAFA